MKQYVMAFLFTGTFLLSGCSGLLDQVNDTTTYVTEANEYVTDIQQFTEDFPQLAEEAVQDVAKRADLTQQLESLKADIQEFNELTAPSIAEDLHAQIIEKNKVLSEEIQTYLQQLKMDNFDAAAILEDQQGLMKQLQQSVNLLQDIEQLTN
ncbi:hypothetical protein FBF75_06575 [Bacillus sp. S2(2019)]|uniref:DUF6376 family protein n=1 Tax=Bacillus sp. BS1807G30 TaxID=3153756 RepID=A0AAU7FHX2_9BACI|nr:MULTISPECIES: DUF6376 family protein [Bacillus]BAT50231.1 uncharacterized protein BTUAT1_30970 [Bacillus pumilus]APP15728.1 hypothetical protein BS467_08305 [Bacillus altitudinis]MBG9901945.1 lipoprotein [Bacillus altitudinis]MBL7244021.1 hypothetical protein [Bacillus altitudinis]MDJ0286684.1 DUF6376 family protein [Bacillus altitudinis]